ncbi:ABC transporter substrate-binding protein [Brevibacterium oceani]|uniref:ABC transporter substrate-binding protein n=1 Tax=Brevibacterium oceani TaxID=358099 RepID=UPI0015E79FD7|nr:ABC transporter substrate-binding protein [Brevibacterium oceani]
MHNSFGDVTIERKPERVATLGYADLALASSMGSEIVLAPEFFSSVSGGDTEKSLPYIDSLPAETEWLNPMSIDVEQVAAAEPDVILATAAFSLDENIYSQLNDIAPVVSYEEGLYQASSEASSQRIGEVLGEEEMAEQLITDANDAVAQVKQDLPNLDGGTFLYGQARDDVAAMLVDKENVTARFMLGLGMEALPAVAELGGKGSVPGAVDISLEQADLFNDAGVMFMTYQSDAAKTAFESNPIIAEQPIMDDRYVPVGLEAATALQDPNVVSVPWLLDEIRPGLEKVPEN